MMKFLLRKSIYKSVIWLMKGFLSLIAII